MTTKMIPHSVRMRAHGFVYNPQHKFMTSPWVNAIENMEKKIAFNKRVDRTVDVLTRFVAKWVAQSRTARSAWNSRVAGETWRNAALSPNWADMAEKEENEIARARAEADARFEARLMAMSDADLIQYHQMTMAEHRLLRNDYRPWMDFIAGIHRKRAAQRVALADNAQVWVELHNQQRPAQVRRVIPRGRFSALNDSDSE
jgi:hypothetical protein